MPITCERRRNARPSKVITVAKANFDIAAGGTQDIKAKITGPGKKLVRKRKPMYAIIKIGGQQIAAGSITLTP
jgi:hypothetical protein